MNIDEIKQMLESHDLGYEVQTATAGVRNPMERHTVWVDVDREELHDVVALLIEEAEEFPHFSVISPSDAGDSMLYNYHFTLSYGTFCGEIAVTLRVPAPKDDLWVPTLTDLIPGTEFSEREVIEMTGADVRGLHDKRHLFLTPDFPDGVYPWRRDETAPEETNKLYEGWKE
ncbi:MAG: NADH-quinone oxidoreductase subunit C [Thermoplasmatota archaeon]